MYIYIIFIKITQLITHSLQFVRNSNYIWLLLIINNAALFKKKHSFTTFVFVCYLVLCNLTGGWGIFLGAWWRRYRWTRRQLLFFTCFPHRGQKNGPWSSPWTSRMCTLRLNLFLKTREHRGHPIMYIARDNQPVQTEKRDVIQFYCTRICKKSPECFTEIHISLSAWN
jgi:hypothetical protein